MAIHFRRVEDQEIESIAIGGNNLYVAVSDAVLRSPIMALPGSTDTTIKYYWINCLDADSNVVFAGTDNGIFKSTDNGNHWIFTNTLKIGDVISIKIKGNNIYVGSYSYGFYRSTDGGNDWQQCNRGNNNYILSLVSNANNIYSGIYGGLFVSSDDGANWQPVNNDFINDTVTCIGFNPDYFFAGIQSKGMYRSSDNGTTWQACNNGLTYNNINKIVIDSNYIFSITNGGIFVSTDNGNNWKSANNGLTSFEINSVAISGNNLFIGTDFGLFESKDFGQNWQLNSKHGTDAYFVTSKDINVYLFTYDSLFKSTDKGESWNLISKGYYYNISCVIVSDSILFFGQDNYVYISTNSGLNWRMFPNVFGYDYNNNGTLILETNNGYIYAGTQGQGIYRAKISDLLNILDVPYSNDVKKSLIYPNPTSDFLIINSSNMNGKNISIYDMLGNKLKSVAGSGDEFRINIESLQTGIYLIKIGELTKIFVKE